MEEKKELDALKLGNELTIRRYLLNKEQGNRVLSVPDYIALHTIKETANQEEIYVGRTYLKDLSEKMQLSIRKTSNMVGNLKNRGLVAWSHDGNGSDGTYVTITELGEQLLEQQQSFFEKFYGRVIDKFGKDNFIQLLNLMKQMETVMSSELEEMEGGMKDDGTVE
ncbi:MAG: MarR family winged helix-turn-helix transcriptional regulator [Lachnospiraceae bacterium]